MCSGLLNVSVCLLWVCVGRLFDGRCICSQWRDHRPGKLVSVRAHLRYVKPVLGGGGVQCRRSEKLISLRDCRRGNTPPWWTSSAGLLHYARPAAPNTPPRPPIKSKRVLYIRTLGGSLPPVRWMVCLSLGVIVIVGAPDPKQPSGCVG